MPKIKNFQFKKGNRYSKVFINQVCKANNWSIVSASSQPIELLQPFIVNTISETYYFTLSLTHGWTGGKSYNYICS